MGKNVLKYGGKSGLLPKVQPIFKDPIRPLNEHELEEYKKATKNTGYAKGIPSPVFKGKPFPRHQKPKRVVTVAKKIARIEFPKMTLQEMNELPPDERDAQRRAYYRAQFLKEAYLEEEKRLKAADKLAEERREKELKQSQRAQEEKALEHDRGVQGLPTLQKLLDEGMMKFRSPQQKKELKMRRNVNRLKTEAKQKDVQLEKLLQLYHAAANFITTEQQLEEAIHRAFDVDVGDFEFKQSTVESKLSGSGLGYLAAETNENYIADQVLGRIRGKPGLKEVKDVLSNEREKQKREAKMSLSRLAAKEANRINEEELMAAKQNTEGSAEAEQTEREPQQK
ncbi:hypothetical protein Cantr_06974 [Candida viswanathii]|jgi:hypothetical protein|uniref:37S ribosomal protein PET123, mitochondrial n=1 Tax=Candida viswanathii TaxID=5486 RepID=A0A367XZE0_9ASCO|nr:hypothetical protein Cantr_06974 [Candida viswanathii]